MQTQPDPWPPARYLVEALSWPLVAGALAACWWGLNLIAR